MKIDHIIVETEVLGASQGRSTAFVSPPVENETQRVLREALALLGPNGELWNHGPEPYKGSDAGLGGCKCIGWALSLAQGSSSWVQSCSTRANRMMDAACEEEGYNGYVFFNEEAPSFSEVRDMFHRAIALAAIP